MTATVYIGPKGPNFQSPGESPPRATEFTKAKHFPPKLVPKAVWETKGTKGGVRSDVNSTKIGAVNSAKEGDYC